MSATKRFVKRKTKQKTAIVRATHVQMRKGKSSTIKFSSLTRAARQPISHEADRPEHYILNTEITEKEMAKIATTIITVPEKSGSRVHQPKVAHQE